MTGDGRNIATAKEPTGFVEVTSGCSAYWVGFTGSDAVLVCLDDCWNYAYSASHELAGHRYGFQHSAEMFAEQAKPLRKLRSGASGSSKRN